MKTTELEMDQKVRAKWSVNKQIVYRKATVINWRRASRGTLVEIELKDGSRHWVKVGRLNPTTKGEANGT